MKMGNREREGRGEGARAKKELLWWHKERKEDELWLENPVLFLAAMFLRRKDSKGTREEGDGVPKCCLKVRK